MVAANKAVFAKVAYRESGAGVVGILQAREANFDSLVLKKHPLVLVLEGVEKPGNLGAMLRTANAAGVDAVLVCDPLADIYNPNCIRASLGAVFATPVLSCTSAQAIRWLQKSNCLFTSLTWRRPYRTMMPTCEGRLRWCWGARLWVFPKNGCKPLPRTSSSPCRGRWIP